MNSHLASTVTQLSHTKNVSGRVYTPIRLPKQRMSGMMIECREWWLNVGNDDGRRPNQWMKNVFGMNIWCILQHSMDITCSTNSRQPFYRNLYFVWIIRYPNVGYKNIFKDGLFRKIGQKGRKVLVETTTHNLMKAML